EASMRGLHWLDRCKHAEPGLRARVLTNLGRTSYSLGQTGEAMDYFERSLLAATDAESLFRIANAHMNLGVGARATGDLDRAIEHCNRALELYRRIGHTGPQTACSTTSATSISRRVGRWRPPRRR